MHTNNIDMIFMIMKELKTSPLSNYIMTPLEYLE